MSIVRNLSIQDYLDSERISHSKLKTFAEGGPRLYSMTYLQKTLKRTRSKDFMFGNAFETLFQRPHDFAKEVIVAPMGYDGRKTKTENFKSFKDSVVDAGKDYITHDELLIMQNMVEAANEHDLASVLCSKDNAEQQVTITADLCGLPCQCRPDYVSLSGCPETNFEPYEVNLKTTSSFSRFDRELFDYGYHSQAAMVRDIMDANGYTKCRSYQLVVEKDIPHRVALFLLPAPVVRAGHQWCVDQLLALADCYAKNDWPRVIQGELSVELPKWIREE